MKFKVCINCNWCFTHPDTGKKFHNDDFIYQCNSLPMPVRMTEEHAAEYHCSNYQEDLNER